MVIKLKDLKQEIGMHPGNIDLNLPYLPLSLLMKECGVDPDYGNMLLQYHGYRDHDGNWSKEMIDHGYVVKLSFTLQECTRSLTSRHNVEIVAPHAVAFFKAFFQEENLD